MTAGDVQALRVSKAFTREDSGAEMPTIRPVPTLAPGEVRYITREGHAGLIAERTRFEEQRAALKDDAALDAKARRTELEARIGAIDGLLGILTVAEHPADTERVFFGASVSLEDEEGKPHEYRIVGPDEAEVREGRISVDSPLARQLLGRSEGEVVELHRPRGTTELTITGIRY